MQITHMNCAFFQRPVKQKKEAAGKNLRPLGYLLVIKNLGKHSLTTGASKIAKEPHGKCGKAKRISGKEYVLHNFFSK